MPESELLFRFQLRGDREALVEFGASLGYREVGLRATLDALQPIFESVALGEPPQCDHVDRRRLLEHREEAAFVLRMMSGSFTAAIKAAALQLLDGL